MTKNKVKKGRIAIYWNDIRVYHDGGNYKPTPAYTEGELIHSNNKCICLKNPETILFSVGGPKNHPNKKARWYTIPRALVSSIIYVEKSNKKH